MNTGILKAEGLCKSYGSKRVLEGLDLTIQPGRIYGLIGRNGAGKTTLISILSTLLLRLLVAGLEQQERRRHPCSWK